MQNITDNELVSLADGAIQAALDAGARIMAVYASVVEVELKADKSPLTEADRQAHTAIVASLGRLDQRIPVLSEEGRHESYRTRSAWERFWLVDPLDGTKEFIKRNGEFTVNIALLRRQDEGFIPVLGVVYVPVADTLYLGLAGQGAWKVAAAREGACGSLSQARQLGLALPRQDALTGPIRAVVSRSHDSAETGTFIARLEQQYGPVQRVASGSSIKLCLVAEGAADVYPRLAPTMEWDTAAGDAVCRSAGCTVVDAGTKTPLAYNKEDLHNPWFIASGPRMKE